MMRTNGTFAKEGRQRISMEASVKRSVFALAGVIAGIQAIPALAHHSFAMFDTARQVTLQGTVQEFQWTNPHAWVILTVDKKGRAEQWAVEMIGPNGLVRQGWRPRTLTPGMPVTLTIHPLKDGTNGGQFMDITLPDGTTMSAVGPRPQ
jgi:Family of unknown function (DUF6152)